MALALAFAAFVGAAAGLLWHASGLGQEEEEAAPTGAAEPPAPSPAPRGA